MKNNKGAALIIVIMVMTVLMVIGVSFLTVSVSDVRLASAEEQRLQAYYIARSGAEATAAWMMSSDSDLSILNDLILNGSTSNLTDLDNGNFQIALNEPNPTAKPREIIITSTGRVPAGSGFVSQNVKLSMIENSLFDAAIFAQRDIIHEKNSVIKGDIQAIGNIIGDGDIEGTATPWVTGKSYPAPIINTPTVVADWDTDLISITYNPKYENILYRKIDFGNKNIDFELNHDLILTTNVFSLGNGTISINQSGSENPGRLIVVIPYKNTLSQPQVDIRGNIFADMGDFILIADMGADINMQTGNSDKFNGYIYAPGSDISLKRGIYNGAIIGNNITIKSGEGVTHVSVPANYLFPKGFGFGSSSFTKGRWED